MRCLVLCILLTMSSFSFADHNEKAISHQTRFKLYCMYTPQFQNLYEQYFLPSIKDDFEIVVREYPEVCPSGLFRSAGWDRAMLYKLELLREAIEEHWGDQIFFYSDVDIIFLRPALETVLVCLGNHDFVVQQGWPRNTLCAGFFVMKGNEKTLKLINAAIDLMEKKLVVDDQIAIQTVLSGFKEREISWVFLPPEQFPNGDRVLKDVKKGQYPGNSELLLDDSIILFHANCTKGLSNKYRFLSQVQEEFLRK